MTVHHNRPQHKARDTGIAFLMTAISYAIVGGGYYAAFPHSKNLIADVSKKLSHCLSVIRSFDWMICDVIDWYDDHLIFDLFSYDQVIERQIVFAEFSEEFF